MCTGILLDNIAFDSSLTDLQPLGHLRACTASYAQALNAARSCQSSIQDWSMLDMRRDRTLAHGAGHQLNGQAQVVVNPVESLDRPTVQQVENAILTHSKAAHIAMEFGNVLAPLEEAMKQEVRWDHTAVLAAQAQGATRTNATGTMTSEKPGSTQTKRARFADDVVDPAPDTQADDAAIEEAMYLSAQDFNMPPSYRWKWVSKVLASQNPSFKAIVYSSSRQVLQDVQVKLQDYYGPAAVATYYSNQKDSADITKFRNQTSYAVVQCVVQQS
jgi:hypothetical protein